MQLRARRQVRPTELVDERADMAWTNGPFSIELQVADDYIPGSAPGERGPSMVMENAAEIGPERL